jgi:hypothetical protein
VNPQRHHPWLIIINSGNFASHIFSVAHKYTKKSPLHLETVIFQCPLNYDFPIILFYYPECWKTTINVILNENSNDILVRLKEWLKES